jgi:signal peptidase II
MQMWIVMNSKGILRTAVILSIVMLNMGCDQFTKNLIRERVGNHEQIELISDHFTLTRVENTGAFLSLGDSLPAPLKDILLSVIPLLALTMGLGYVLFRTSLPPVVLTGVCFILGGGMGNIYDRLQYGSVTDFLHINLGFLRTGIFNMADLSISIGVFIIILQLFSRKNPVQ